MVTDEKTDQPYRPAFLDGQVLRAAALRSESNDREQAARRHQSHVHVPGILAGLRLKVDGRVVKVSPGMAITSDGQFIIVGNGVKIEEELTSDNDVEVWIALPSNLTSGETAANATKPEIELVNVQAGHSRIDPQSRPQHAAYLGKVRCKSAHPPAQPEGNAGSPRNGLSFFWELDPAEPNYVGAVGARIEAPSRQARLQLAPERPTDVRHFAIATRDLPTGNYVDRFVYDATDTIRIAAGVNVDSAKGGVAVIEVGKNSSHANDLRGISFVGARQEGKEARKNQLYLTTHGDLKNAAHQLRLEFVSPGKANHPERHQVAIGSVTKLPNDAKQLQFASNLTVDASRRVTVHGGLKVVNKEGTVTKEETGLLIVVKGATDVPGGTVPAEQLGLVKPWDVVIDMTRPTLSKDGVINFNNGRLTNSGEAPMQGVQLFAKAWATAQPNDQRENKTLLHPRVLDPGESVAVQDWTLETALKDNPAITIELTAFGVGPGNVVAQDKRILDCKRA